MKIKKFITYLMQICIYICIFMSVVLLNAYKSSIELHLRQTYELNAQPYCILILLFYIISFFLLLLIHTKYWDRHVVWLDVIILIGLLIWLIKKIMLLPFIVRLLTPENVTIALICGFIGFAIKQYKS